MVLDLNDFSFEKEDGRIILFEGKYWKITYEIGDEYLISPIDTDVEEFSIERRPELMEQTYGFVPQSLGMRTTITPEYCKLVRTDEVIFV